MFNLGLHVRDTYFDTCAEPFDGSEAITAARDCRAPVVGTGGTSLGTALAMGCFLVGSSGGSVATTNKVGVV